MKKVRKIVLPICAAVILSGAGVFLYFNAQAKVENPLFSLDESVGVSGYYTIPNASQGMALFSLTEDERIAKGGFYLTKKQKEQFNRWAAGLNFENKTPVFQHLVQYSFRSGSFLSSKDAKLGVKQIKYKEDIGMTETSLIYPEEATTRYIAYQFIYGESIMWCDITWEQYQEFIRFFEKAKYDNHRKMTNVIDWQSIEPKTAVLEFGGCGGTEQIDLTKEQIKQVQDFFIPLDKQMVSGTCSVRGEAVRTGGIDVSIHFKNGVDSFNIGFTTDEKGSAIYVNSLIDSITYMIADETYLKFAELCNSFLISNSLEPIDFIQPEQRF